MEKSRDVLARRLGPDRLEQGVPLAPMTTFRIGGPADLLYRARTPDELALAVTVARELEMPWVLLGRGANVLVGDRGVRGLVIRNEVQGIEFLDERRVRAGPLGAGRPHVRAHAPISRSTASAARAGSGAAVMGRPTTR